VACKASDLTEQIEWNVVSSNSLKDVFQLIESLPCFVFCAHHILGS